MKGVSDSRDLLNRSVTEKEWGDTVLEIARMRGWLSIHFRPAQRRNGRWETPLAGDLGFPDLVMARAPRLLIAELKAENGSPSLAQRHWLGVLNACTQLEAHIWRPSDVQGVLKTLAREV